MQLRHALFAVASSVAFMLVAQSADAEQKIETKSNIKNDAVANSCTKNCVDKGYEWAEKNKPASDEDCDAKSADFAAGCKHYVEEQAEIAAGPLTEDAADAAHEKAKTANEATEDSAKASKEAAEDASKASHEAAEKAADAAEDAADKPKP